MADEPSADDLSADIGDNIIFYREVFIANVTVRGEVKIALIAKSPEGAAILPMTTDQAIAIGEQLAATAREMAANE